MMRFATAVVEMSISLAATRSVLMGPAAFCVGSAGSRCCAKTARNTSASWRRMPSCSPAGKTAVRRSIEPMQSPACSVAKTRCPVSAATIAVRIVSRSRASPSRITSGSWRIDETIASLKLGASTPTWRWLITLRIGLWTYSTGSSIVTTWLARVRLMRSSSAASVVLLPAPVGPQISTRPSRRSQKS